MSETNYWTRLRRQQISRRRLLRSAALGGVGAAGLALVGCGDDDDEEEAVAEAPAPAAEPAEEEEMEEEAAALVPSPAPNAASPDRAQSGGTLTLSRQAPPTMLDPHFGQTAWGQWLWMSDPLLEDTRGTASPITEPRLSLLTSLEFVDDLTLTLSVRAGVPFHDKPPINGRILEARDVVYSLNSSRGVLFPDERSQRTSGFRGVAEIQAMDPSTVQVAFSEPSSVFTNAVLAELEHTIIPEGLREDFGGTDSLQDQRAERHIGTGPFTITQYDPTILWERNPNYWNQPFPYLDRVEFLLIPDRAANIAALLSGQIDVAGRISAEERALVEEHGDFNFELHWPGGYRHMGFNHTLPKGQDPRIRRALNIVYDQPAIGRAIVGNDEDWRFTSPLGFVFPEAFTREQLEQREGFRSPTEADVTTAKQYFDAAGFGDGGFEISIRTPNLPGGSLAFVEQSEHLSAQVEKHLPGNKVAIELSTFGEVLAAVQSGEFEMFLSAFAFEADATQMLTALFRSDSSQNLGRYQSAQMNGLIDEAFRAVGDPEERLQAIRNAQELALEDMPIMYSTNNLQGDAVRKSITDMIYGAKRWNDAFYRYAWIAT